MNQTDRLPSRRRCARRAASQRRVRFAINVLAGALLSLGALATLQAASVSCGTLPVKQSVDGGGGRLFSGVGAVGFTADVMPYAVVAGLRKTEMAPPQASEAVSEPAEAIVEAEVVVAETTQAEPALSEEAVLAAIDQWAKAWQSKDVAGYLAAYGEDFRPANGISRDDWAKLRQQRIADKHVIRLELRDIEIQPETADRVRVNFVQDYRADQFVERGTAKSMVLALEKDGWRILAEESVR